MNETLMYGDDDGDHSAFTHRDDDEPPPYEPAPASGEPGTDRLLATADSLLDSLPGPYTVDQVIDQMRALVSDLRLALASTATPPEPGLDRERLATELLRWYYDHTPEYAHQAAADILARLSASPIPSEEHPE